VKLCAALININLFPREAWVEYEVNRLHCDWSSTKLHFQTPAIKVYFKIAEDFYTAEPADTERIFRAEESDVTHLPIIQGICPSPSSAFTSEEEQDPFDNGNSATCCAVAPGSKRQVHFILSKKSTDKPRSKKHAAEHIVGCPQDQQQEKSLPQQGQAAKATGETEISRPISTGAPEPALLSAQEIESCFGNPQNPSIKGLEALISDIQEIQQEIRIHRKEGKKIAEEAKQLIEEQKKIRLDQLRENHEDRQKKQTQEEFQEKRAKALENFRRHEAKKNQESAEIDAIFADTDSDDSLSLDLEDSLEATLDSDPDTNSDNELETDRPL